MRLFEQGTICPPLLQKNCEKKIRKFVDAGFVKTCDEFVIGYDACSFKVRSFTSLCSK